MTNLPDGVKIVVNDRETVVRVDEQDQENGNGI